MHVSVLFQVYAGFSSYLILYCGHGIEKRTKEDKTSTHNESLVPFAPLIYVEPIRAQNHIKGAPDWSVVVCGP